VIVRSTAPNKALGSGYLVDPSVNTRGLVMLFLALVTIKCVFEGVADTWGEDKWVESERDEVFSTSGEDS